MDPVISHTNTVASAPCQHARKNLERSTTNSIQNSRELHQSKHKIQNLDKQYNHVPLTQHMHLSTATHSFIMKW